MFSCIHTLIGGFLQNYSSPENGLPGIEYELKKLYTNCSEDLTEVAYHQWLIDPKDYVRRCVRFGFDRDKKQMAKIQLVGYSFGAQTVQNMLMEYHALQIPVQKVILIDPVRRDSRYPWGYLQAFNRFARFIIPSNVQDVTVFYQRQNWPRGHRVETLAGSDTVLQRHELHLDHTICDNAPIVRRMILQQAEALHKEKL